MDWVVFTLIAAVLLGMKSVCAKKVLFQEHACEFMTTYSLLTFVFSLFFLYKMNFSMHYTVVLLIYAKSFVLCIAWLFQTKALRHMDLSKTAPLLNLSPIFLIIFSAFFLNEIPTLVQFLGITFIIVGAYWLQSHHNIRQFLKPLHFFKSKYSIYILIALVGYSMCAIIDKIVLKSINPYTYLFFSFLFLTLNYLIIQFYKYDGWKDIEQVIVESKGLIFAVVVFGLIADILYFHAVAIPTAMIALIIPLKRISTLVATIVGGSLFHEKNLSHRVIGCVIMILGVFLIVI